jgi:hypothetical protein
MKKDPEFGEFWQIIYDEFLESKRLLLKIAGHKELMENYPDGKASIQIRERIVLPLTIQQYALLRINELNKESAPDENLIKVYEKIVMRSLLETQTQVETQHKHTKNEIKPTSYRIRSLIRSLYSAFEDVNLIEELEISLHDFIKFVQNIPMDKFDYRYRGKMDY